MFIFKVQPGISIVVISILAATTWYDEQLHTSGNDKVPSVSTRFYTPKPLNLNVNKKSSVPSRYTHKKLLWVNGTARCFSRIRIKRALGFFLIQFGTVCINLLALGLQWIRWNWLSLIPQWLRKTVDLNTNKQLYKYRYGTLFIIIAFR